MKKIIIILGSILATFSFVYAYTTEQRMEWYEWAYINWLTTQTLQSVKLDWYITRQALAKMLVVFSNMIWISPDYSQKCNFIDNYDIVADLRPYVQKACYLWLMWVNTKLFNPMDYVSRAQFASVLSRALWWDKYNWWEPYYIKHLNALISVWIVENEDVLMSRSYKRWDIMYTLKKAYEYFSKQSSVKLVIYSTSHPLQEAKVGEPVKLSLNYPWNPSKIVWDFWDWSNEIECKWKSCSEVVKTWDRSWSFLIKVSIEYEDGVSARQRRQFDIIEQK